MNVSPSPEPNQPTFVTNPRTVWQGLQATFLYFLLVFFGGAALAPWVYKLCLVLGEYIPWISGVSEEPFRRYVNRCLLVMGILGLKPFLKSLKINSLVDLGWSGWTESRGVRLREVGNGFIVGFGAVGGFILVSVFFGARELSWNWDGWIWIQKALSAVLTAGFVGVLEETLFRGGLFGGFQSFMRIRWAMLFSAMVYSALHFFAKPENPEVINWLSGWISLGQMSLGILERDQMAPGFINLTVAGLFLAWVYHKKGNLFWSAGIHGGWVFALKMSRGVSNVNLGGSAWIWGDERFVNGWAAAIPILLSWLCLMYAWKGKGKGG